MTMQRISGALSDYEMSHRGLGHRAFVPHRGETNLSVVAISVPGNKLADLGQFPEQSDNVENVEIRKILSLSDPKKGTFYNQVHVTPTHMEFKDPSEGMVFRKTMTIRNVGKVPAIVRICQPNSMALKIKSLKKSVMLSPGLALTRRVTYSFKRPALLHATIPIKINSQLIDYHVICSISTEYITIEPTSIDFGIVDIGCSSGTKIITISNVGGKSTRFTVDLGKNDMEINTKPHRGIVRPRSSIQLHVEMIGITEGTFYSEFWIKSTPNIRVPIRVNIIVPRLVIYYPNTTGDFTLVDFPPTFVKTRRYNTLVLRNISSQFSSFVVLGEIDNELVPLKDIDPDVHVAYSVFKISPVEGRLEPFEGTIFDIEFAPTSVVRNQDFMAFVRIFRVHCREAEDVIIPGELSEPSADFPRQQKVHIQEDATSNSSKDEDENSVLSSVDQHTSLETVRLCIHGETEVAQLRFVPNELHLDNFKSCGMEKRVLTIENPSKNTSLGFRFVANGNAHCEPSEGSLGPAKARQVLVIIGGKNIRYVEPRVKLAFDVIVKTHSVNKSRKLIEMKVATFYINCFVKCGPMKSINTAIKYSPGLTANLSNSGTVSVFTSTIRYSPEPDPSLALSESEIAQKKKNQEYWADYLRTLQRYREKKAESKKLENPTEGCEELEAIVHNCEIIPKIEKFEARFDINRLCKRAKMKMGLRGMHKEKTLVPLSPLQIYNVKISPTMFTFGAVVTKSVSSQELLIENKNNFPVMMRLVSLSSRNIRFPKGNSMILRPGTSVRKLVEFRADQIGKFSSYIDYVINDNHSFELTITADVVYKFLTLSARELVLGGSEDYSPEESYRPLTGYIEVKNKLNARTNFKWDVPTSASYIIDPLAGSVRGKRNLLVSVSYEPDAVKTQNTEAVIVTEGGTYMTLKLNTLVPLRPRVAFLNDPLNVGEIPLNVPYTTLGIIHNAEYNQVVFEIDETSLAHGWQVYPRRGIIPPRGIALIQIVLRFEVCLSFTITVRAIIQKCSEIRVRVTGQVSFPMLKLEPEKIEMRRISADASQTHILTATNVGKTLLTLRFPLQDYPEFHVSFTDPPVTEQHSELEKEAGMIVLPGHSRSLYLHFTPVDLASYAFYLPMMINEILGPVVMENPKSSKPQEYLSSNEGWYLGSSNITIIKPPESGLPTIFIDCTVSGHVISFSKLVFSFDASTDELQDTLRIWNDTNRDTSFIIRIDQLEEKDSPFAIKWDNRGVKVEIVGVSSIVCTLKAGLETYLRISFDPNKGRQGDFSVEAPIFVRGQLDGAMFNRLKLEGKNPRGRIESDIREIYLCPIRLKAETEERFEIWTSHFDKNSSITVKVMEPDRLVGEFRRDLLSVMFPRGNTVEAARAKRRGESIEVCLTFRSTTPISFRTKLEFKDSENQAGLSITVFATADNSLLTIHAFPISSGDAFRTTKYEFQGSSHPSIESEISDNCSIEKQGSGVNKKRLNEDTPRLSMHSNTSQSSWNVAKILNSMKIKSPPFKETINNGQQTEEDEELEITSILGVSGFSLISPDHQSKPRRNSRLNYLFFPFHARGSVYEQHMQRTLKVAEQWLYSGPLRYQFYPHVLNGITAFLSNLCTVKTMQIDKRKIHKVNQSFIDILVAIVGPEFYDFIGIPSPLPDDDSERIVLVLKMYENMLNFLLAQGAHVCHVSALYLLNYSDYEITLDNPTFVSASRKTWLGNNSPPSDRMPSHLFDARSKQCWLDLILQTFKSLVLKRITPDGLKVRLSGGMVLGSIDLTSSESATSLSNPLSEASITSIGRRARSKTIYSEQESLLLAWLEHHYGQQRREDWLTDERAVLNLLEGKDEPRERTITNFEEDLADSLALIAATVAYCPFLIEESFRNVYIRPRSHEEALHNGICVVAAWQKIRLGFIITAQEIARPNSVQMLMLVVHLFKILPTYLPRSKVKFSCPLTETVTRSLSFTNSTDSQVAYLLQFFGNNSGFFNVPQSNKIFRLNARNTSTIKIQFQARKIQKTRAYLVLCGGAIGPNFAKNQCFVLEGGASHLGIVEEYKIRSRLYKVLDKTLSIRVPYGYATEYEIFMTEEMPDKPGTIKMERWSELRSRKVPRRLFLNQKSIAVLENAHAADLSITVACIAPNKRNFWIVFQSRLGDFIIQISSSSQTSITDHITVKWERESCICTDPATSIVGTCPLNISVGIPSRNIQLWNCVSQMFQKSLNSKERIFWSRHLETNIGLRLIYWLMGDHADSTAQEFIHLFDSSVTYTVSTSDKSSPLVIAEKFTISDVRVPAGDEMEMRIHVNESTPQIYETTLSLVSLDKRENRLYNIDFLCYDPSGSRKITFS